jgi:hypothetical protein
MLISKRDRTEPYKGWIARTIIDIFTRTMAIHRMTMTDDQIEEIFVQPEHRAQLRTVTPLLRHMSGPNPYVTGTCKGMEFKASRMGRDAPFMVPRYAMDGKEVEVPGMLREELMSQWDIATRWHGEYQMLLQILNWIDGEKRLETWEQVRFVFPAIVPLLDMTTNIHIHADDKLRAAMRKSMKPYEKITTLPVAFRQACREATQIVSRMKLMQNASLPPTETDCWTVTVKPRDEPNALFPDGIPEWAPRIELSR